MKNNKGFTLIELLAVVVILITIIVIITPKVFKQLKTAENVTDKEQINAIINASQIYMNQNSNFLPNENDLYVLSLDELKESGLIQKKQILNPSTNEELTGCIVVKYEKNKYKYEYKEENDCNNIITVTFDPQGGQLDQTTKQVIPNDTYGDLPTPTREGYKFIGWTSKNLAPEINESNYTSDHFNNRTTTEFRNENGTNYIRINGNPSNENIDTMWRIYPINGKTLHQGNYVLSFDVRSQNSLLTQNIMKKIDRNSGKTGIYIDDATKIDNMISNIENDYNFDNDGEWHHFTSLVTIPYNTSNALIVIGNDKPNLYGPNSYIDIKNIQLEPGNTATPYEPYYITSDTTVVQENNHTLKAIWQAN